MGYGDLQFYDIVIFAAIAIFLVFRLRKVLGKRTGFEKKQADTIDKTLKHPEEKDLKEDMPHLEENMAEFKKAYIAIDGFDHKSFLDGAKSAFETIINAFNNGDKKTLKGLLNEDVYKIFVNEIDQKHNDPESQIFSLNVEKIEKVIIESGKISIKIKFISEQFKNNDEKTISKKIDIWSFEKLIKSKNPNWLLSST